MTAAAAVSVIVMQKYWHVAPPGLWIVDTSTSAAIHHKKVTSTHQAARFTAGLAGQICQVNMRIIIMILDFEYFTCLILFHTCT